jgi:DNA-binding MarR family transcriptional regulator
MDSKNTQAAKSLRVDAAAMVANCPGWNVRFAARLVTQFLDQEFKACGLGVAQLGLMAEIAAAADDSLGALAQRAGLDPSTLSRNLRKLEAAGLVEIAIVDGDLRRRMVWLTETGAHRLEAALPLWSAASAKLGAKISSATARALADAARGLDKF